MAITKKQKEVYDYICEYCEDFGYSPTQEEIRKHFGLKSLGSVQRYIQYLVNAGYLKNSWNARRGLGPISQKAETSSHEEIPLMGKVAAGTPIEARFSNESVSVPPSLLPKGESFALQVTGQSMIEDGIFDGDIIIVEKKATFQNGETVVANLQGEATVKKAYKKGSTIELHPANSSMKPFLIKGGDFRIEGIVRGLLRSF